MTDGPAGHGGGAATSPPGSAGAGPGTGGAVDIAAPTILSIDFVGGLNATGAVAEAPGEIPITPGPTLMSTEVAGFKPAANWNSAFGPVGALSALTLADGTTSNTSVTWSTFPTTVRSGVWALGFFDGPDAIMMNGYLDPPSSTTPGQVRVVNLPPSVVARGYDVYVYCMGAFGSVAETRTYVYRIGTTTLTVSQTGPVAARFAGFEPVAQNGGAGNVLVFHGITGASFTLFATPGTGISTRAPVNGIQIVSPPEPGPRGEAAP